MQKSYPFNPLQLFKLSLREITLKDRQKVVTVTRTTLFHKLVLSCESKVGLEEMKAKWKIGPKFTLTRRSQVVTCNSISLDQTLQICKNRNLYQIVSVSKILVFQLIQSLSHVRSSLYYDLHYLHFPVYHQPKFIKLKSLVNCHQPSLYLFHPLLLLHNLSNIGLFNESVLHRWPKY